MNNDPASTRAAYRETLLRLMPRHPRLVCVDTDTGLFQGADFGAAADRYIDVGIAEMTAFGAAAGLAAGGFIPFVNTMAAFAATRAAEAVKLDIAYPELPVRIAATHGGLSAGHFGPSHQALEDLAVMRSLPGLTVLVPGDAAQTADLIGQTLDLPGPVYLRLDRKVSPAIGAPEPRLGRLQMLRPGSDVLIVACGPHPVDAATHAARELALTGVSAAVLNAHTLSPFDTETLSDAASSVWLVVTIEEHWTTGGLGDAVAEGLGATRPRPMLRIGMPRTFADTAGDHDDLLRRHGLGRGQVAARIRRAVRDGGPPPQPPEV